MNWGFKMEILGLITLVNYTVILQKMMISTRYSQNGKTLEAVIKNNQNPLDYPVTEPELTEVIQSLKGKKACGVDGVLNEMIKYSDHKIRLAILKLFNTILSTGTFPDIWNKGFNNPNS